MAAYILYGISASSLLAAVIMTAPGTILISKMLVPETEKPATEGTVKLPEGAENKDENLIGSIARGTIDGGRLAFNVGIMLISFLALIALLNGDSRRAAQLAGVASYSVSAFARRDSRIFL
jgi:CNT family concentrative nucleoside transporter